MATFRSRLRNPVKKATKKATKKAAKKATKKATTKRTTKKATTKRATTPKERADAAIAAIREAKANTDAEYYAVGKALLKLRTPAIWKTLYAAASFREFLDDYVMPHTTADRLMMIAQSYTKALALQIGLERSFQLARLAEADPKVKVSPTQLWRQNPKRNGKRVQAMSAADMQRLVALINLQKRLAKAKAKAKAQAKAEPDDETVVAEFETEFVEAFGDLGAKIRFNPKNRHVLIDFHVDGLYEDDDEDEAD